MMTEEETMSTLARAKERILSSVDADWLLPSVLGLNSFLLVAIEHHQGIPEWLKAAATLFLVF